MSKKINHVSKLRQNLQKAGGVKPALAQLIDSKFLAGLTEFTNGNPYEALNKLQDVLELEPNHFDALHLSGVAYGQLKQIELSIKYFKKALTVNANSAELHSNLANELNENKEYASAIIHCDLATKLKPNNPIAHYNRGNALIGLNLLGDALLNFDKAIEYKIDYAEAYSNRGIVLNELKRLDEALASYDKALALKPDYAEAHWNRSLLLLLRGDFVKGFVEYEWRWKDKNTGLRQPNLKQPIWLGSEPLNNKTILLYSEQGLGDTLQFFRYAKLVKDSGARVLLQAPETLVGLFQGLGYIDQFIEMDKPLPDFDYHCPLMSLPLAFNTNLTSIPFPTPYIKSDLKKLKIWNEILGEKKLPRVGLAWSGGAKHKNDHQRSLPLTDVVKHLPPNFEYISLQKEVRENDKKILSNSTIRHFEDHLNDFKDTAALCDLLDVVVCVDTSAAHLAGALGKPTWIMLPYMPDWRWMLDRFDSPWYSSVKLYRQGEDRHFAPVLKRVANDLLNYSFENLTVPRL